jgi:hypothetical protein
MSLFGNARALTTGMATLSKKAAKETDGKFQIKIFPRVAKLIRIENIDGLKLNAFARAGSCSCFHSGKNLAMKGFLTPFLPLGDPQVDKYVRMKMFENPIIVDEMVKWNAIPYTSGLSPQYEILGKGKPLLKLSMAGMAFLGAAYTPRMGAHFRMKRLIGKRAGGPYWGAEILATALAMFVVGTLIYSSWIYPDVCPC